MVETDELGNSEIVDWLVTDNTTCTNIQWIPMNEYQGIIISNAPLLRVCDSVSMLVTDEGSVVVTAELVGTADDVWTRQSARGHEVLGSWNVEAKA
jgi:hypothetical protein